MYFITIVITNCHELLHVIGVVALLSDGVELGHERLATNVSDRGPAKATGGGDALEREDVLVLVHEVDRGDLLLHDVERERR